MAGSKPHILLVGGDGGRSGVPTYLQQVTEALQGRARLTIVSDVNSGGYDFAKPMGVTHVEVGGLSTSLRPRRWARARVGLQQAISAASPDLVWAHARMGVGLARDLARSWPAMPSLAVTYHGLPFGTGHRPGTSRLSLTRERRYLQHLAPHDIIFLSEVARMAFCSGVGPALVDRHRSHVLGNCSNLGPIARDVPADREARVLVMAGRAGWQKDHGLAARLMAALPENYRLILCGVGTDTPVIKRLFARHMGAVRAGKAVEFVGPVADMRPWLARADGFLLTSRYEGMPIAALEGFEAGLPLALTNIAGHAEIREAHPMVSTVSRRDLPGSAAALTAQIETFLSAPKANRARIISAWESRFSSTVWRAEMQTLATRLLSEARPRS